MSFYNGILNHDDNHESSQTGQRGLPGIGYKLTSDGNYDIENKKLTNVQNGDANNDVMTKNQIEGYVNNKTQYLDGVLPAQVTNNKAVIYSPSGSIHTNDLYLKDKNGQEVHFYNENQDLNQCRLYVPNLKNNDSYGGRLKSDIMVTSINQTIEGKKVFHDIEVPTPTINGHASNKAYVDNEISKISDASDNSNYVKKSGDTMSGTLNMNNNRITNLPSPHLSTEPATKDYVTTVMNHLPSLFVDRQGKSKMLGNLDINQHKIINVIEPTDDLDVSNKLYTDNQIIKSNIKPNSIPKNVFKYLMDDVNEWSSEYNIKVLNFSDMTESPHYWNKRILNITPLKDENNNYRFRLGIQCFPLDNNKEYTLSIEMYNKDYETWNRQLTYINADTAWIEGYHTQKFQHHYQENGVIYYTKTLIRFKKISTSTPNFIYITYHFEDNDGDMNTYPKEFANQVYILAYGAIGIFNHLDSAVYDKHQAFEIEKNKMKMLVPLDMNNKKILNIPNTSSINLFGKIINNYFTLSSTQESNINIGPFFIEHIILYTSNKFRSQQDTMSINTGKILKLTINYPSTPGNTIIQINKYYDRISTIRMLIASNINFRIIYRVFY